MGGHGLKQALPALGNWEAKEEGPVGISSVESFSCPKIHVFHPKQEGFLGALQPVTSFLQRELNGQ